MLYLRFLAYLYSFLYLLLLPFLFLLSLFYKPLTKQISGRFPNKALLSELAAKRDKCKNAVVFFCSSAGEFEQALPLIQRLEDDKQGRIFVHVFFNSVSGINFAKARNVSMSYSLAPFDWIWCWQSVFKRLKPDISIVVRHELWPSFLVVAARYSKTLIVNVSLNDLRKPVRMRLKAFLLNLFNVIFVVEKQDADVLAGVLRKCKLVVAGDTKYDRVIERAQSKNSEIAHQKLWLQKLFSPQTQYLIIGSAWPADVEIVLEAYAKFLKSWAASDLWRLIIVPHEVNGENLSVIAGMCLHQGLRVASYSQVKASPHLYDKTLQVLLVDTLGSLAEFYGIADLAVVGGAFHFRIHNVLEPAVYGLPIIHGPKYQSQREAKHFVEKGITTEAQSSEDIWRWWQEQAKVPLHAKRPKIIQAVHQFAGASDRIFEQIKKEFN